MTNTSYRNRSIRTPIQNYDSEIAKNDFKNYRYGGRTRLTSVGSFHPLKILYGDVAHHFVALFLDHFIKMIEFSLIFLNHLIREFDYGMTKNKPVEILSAKR